MSPGMVDAIAALSLTFVIGLIILLFPLSRRLGKVLEEWIKLRHESSGSSGWSWAYGRSVSSWKP
jgi:hypothetical protein